MPALVTSLLEANLSAHRAKWGYVPVLDVDDSCIRVEATAGAWPRVSLRVPDGRWLRVHSDRQPLEEAARALAPALDTGGATATPLVCLVGGGYGYALDVLQSQAAQSLKILLIEPEPAFLRLCLGRRDWTPLINAGRLMVLAAPAFEGRTEAWRLVSPEAPDPPIITHPVIGAARESAAREATRIAAQAVLGARANDEARRQFAGPYLLNTLRNLAHIVAGADPGLLRGRFAGVPAVIAGAGPSLDGALPALRELQDRALVIAADTAWRPLVSGGVDPALVVATDPSDLNGRHLLDIPSRQETWVLAEGSVDPQALNASAGRVATFRVAMHHPWPWLQAAGIQRPLVRVWGSVLTAAFDLALTLGCDPIVFVGADLAYTDERTYCRGTTFEREWAFLTASGVSLREIWRASLGANPTVMAPGLNGRDVLTAPRLLEFRNWLVERTTEQQTRRFINATGAGTLFGPRIEQLNLRSALSNQPRREAMFRGILRERLRPAEAGDARVVTDALRSAVSAVARASEDPTGLLAEWLAFGRPSLTREAIRDALDDGRRALEEPRRTAEEPPSGPTVSTGSVSSGAGVRLHEADRAARMRALQGGADSAAVLEGIEPDDMPGEARSVHDLWREIMALTGQLLGSRPLIAEVSGEEEHADLPLSWRFPWRAAAAPLVAQIEERLIALSAIGGERLQEPGALRSRDIWTGTILPVSDHDAASSSRQRRPAMEWLARAALLGMRLDASKGGGWATNADETIAGRRNQRLLAALVDVLVAQVGHLSESGDDGHVTLLGVAGLLPPRFRIDPLMRALTGTVAIMDPCQLGLLPADTQPEPESPRELRVTFADISIAIAPVTSALEPRLVFLPRVSSNGEPETPTILEPDVFSIGKLASVTTVSGDGETVTITHAGDRQSLRIDAEGCARPGPEWPAAITGELPWGCEGGAIAWNLHDLTVMFRSHTDATPVVATAPFRPRALVIDLDNQPLWLAVPGGLWHGFPGAPIRRVIDTPEGASLYVDDGSVWLTPFPRNAHSKFVRRRGLARLRVDPARLSLEREAPGPAGHATSVARRGPWTARTYLYSDLIALTHVDGRSCAVACYAPLRAAWAGDSLVVTTIDPAVLIFRHLLQRMSPNDPAE